MPISKLDILKTRIDAIRTTVARTPEAKKTHNITKTLAENFNTTLAEIAAEFPDLKDALPKPISATGPGARSFGLADAHYIDLEAFCEQVLGLLRLLEEHS